MWVVAHRLTPWQPVQRLRPEWTVTEGDWAAFAEKIDYVPLAAGAGALKDAADRLHMHVGLGLRARDVHHKAPPPGDARVGRAALDRR